MEVTIAEPGSAGALPESEEHMRNQRGQSTLEVAVLMVVVIAALLAMQMYMRRGTQGKLREMSDQVGEQYEPTAANYTVSKGYKGTRTEISRNDGSTQTNFDESGGKGAFRTGTEQPVGRDLSAEKLYTR